MRALITGAGGFVGQWLAQTLLESGYDITGLTPDDPASATLLSAEHLGTIDWIRGDVSRIEDVRRALDVGVPDAIYHLAAVSSLAGASGDPGAACQVNVVGATRLLGEVRVRHRVGVMDPAVLIVGSGQQYGRHDRDDMPLKEDAEQRPGTVYAATKAAQEVMALEAFRSEALRVIAVRPFNHSGPGQSSGFLLPSLIERALAAGKGSDRNARLAVGNMNVVRDFLHVADVVDAYIALVTRGRAGEVYNVSSGIGTSVKDLAVQVLSVTGVKVPLTSDPALVRAGDIPALVGDNTKLKDATGWEPTRTLRDLVEDVVRSSSRSSGSSSSHPSSHAPSR